MSPVVFDEFSHMYGSATDSQKRNESKSVYNTNWSPLCDFSILDNWWSFSYRMSAVVITQIVPETCNAIWKVLVENSYLQETATEAGWCQVAERFY